MVSEKKIFYVFPIITLWELSIADLAQNLTQSIPHPNGASGKIWLRAVHWLWRYSCLKVWTDACTDGRTDGRWLEWYTISSPCEPSAQVS